MQMLLSESRGIRKQGFTCSLVSNTVMKGRCLYANECITTYYGMRFCDLVLCWCGVDILELRRYAEPNPLWVTTR